MNICHVIVWIFISIFMPISPKAATRFRSLLADTIPSCFAEYAIIDRSVGRCNLQSDRDRSASQYRLLVTKKYRSKDTVLQVKDLDSKQSLILKIVEPGSIEVKVTTLMRDQFKEDAEKGLPSHTVNVLFVAHNDQTR
eukprot:739120_1